MGFSNIIEKVNAVAHNLDNSKGNDIIAFDMRSELYIADASVIVTGTSSRHCQSMAEKLTEMCTEKGEKPLGMDGYPTGNWILVDCDDLIIHIMKQETRALYNLEGLFFKAERFELKYD